MYTIVILCGLALLCMAVGKSHLTPPSSYQYEPERERLRLENAYREVHNSKGIAWLNWAWVCIGLAALRTFFWVQGM